MIRIISGMLIILYAAILVSCSPSHRQKATYAVDSNPQSANWELVEAKSESGELSPPAGEDMVVVFDKQKNRFVIFGGKTDEDSTIAETWFYYPSKNQWKKLTGSNLTPPPREDHVLIYDSFRYKIILHGGENGDTSNDLWELDLQTDQWENKADSAAPYLEDHCAVYCENLKGAYLFGGQNEEFPVLDELWFLDLNPESPNFYDWKQIEPKGKRQPAPRIDHAMIYDEKRNRLLVYGGYHKGKKKFNNTTWSFSIATNSWKKLKLKAKKGKFSPSPRRHAGSALDEQNQLWLIFGGDGGYGPLNDTWAFDLENDIWKNMTPGPPPRKDHSVFYNSNSGEIYLYGGDLSTQKSTKKLHDLWKVKLQRTAEK